MGVNVISDVGEETVSSPSSQDSNPKDVAKTNNKRTIVIFLTLIPSQLKANNFPTEYNIADEDNNADNECAQESPITLVNDVIHIYYDCKGLHRVQQAEVNGNNVQSQSECRYKGSDGRDNGQNTDADYCENDSKKEGRLPALVVSTRCNLRGSVKSNGVDYKSDHKSLNNS